MTNLKDIEELGLLFDKAKETDEFEFACSLLRIKGPKTIGWDSMYESQSLIQQIYRLAEDEIDEALRIRLYLMLYCHITEMDAFYNVIVNLLRVCRGDRYCTEPFKVEPNDEENIARYPFSKAVKIKEIAREIGYHRLSNIFKCIVVKQVRNAFTHSDYTLFNDKFRIINGEGVEIDGIITREISFDWLHYRINLALNTATRLLFLISEHRSYYDENKTIKGRMGPNESYIEIELTIQKGVGLNGFRIPPKKENL